MKIFELLYSYLMIKSSNLIQAVTVFILFVCIEFFLFVAHLVITCSESPSICMQMPTNYIYPFSKVHYDYDHSLYCQWKYSQFFINTKFTFLINAYDTK